MLTASLSLSPYLTKLVSLYPELAERTHQESLDELLQQECFSLPTTYASTNELMSQLRIAKNKLALLTAIGDLSGAWSLEKVTRTLSDFANLTLKLSLDYLLTNALKRGEILLSNPESPSVGSGIIVLGMGKLGGFELNYSSDIDLIIFFEKDKLTYQGRHNIQHFMNRIAQDIVNIMQERTRDGYVFRTDLRLRPDPASTPPAVSVGAAYHYYESVGQNWERAAMIKARPVAGDIIAGDAFLQGLTPYIWRRNLDFAAINDIHSIKRQMDARTHRQIVIAGHNVKLGMGGIREIEFYTQIHQLIWGGRKPSLRIRNTCDTLAELVKENIISEEIQQTLVTAYQFLRLVEHRLQMVGDAQTHSLPEHQHELENIAAFSGFDSLASFEKELLHHLHAVHHIYRDSFKSAEELGETGNLVFTGVSSDPDTVKTITQMGYHHAERICETIMGWHHGSRRCTRTKRARELLTELMPALLKRLSETANPDLAFMKFDEFLEELPAGIQLFSLFQMNPSLLGLIADIMGSAPELASHLSRSPQLIENVLFSDFYSALPSKDTIYQMAHERIAYAKTTEEVLELLTYFKNEKQFQAGVQFFKGMIDATTLGQFLTYLAEIVVSMVVEAAKKEFKSTYGTIDTAEFAIIALGKCGSREVTFHSDLDLVFIYHVDDFELVSDGEKSHSASVYYNRFAQRLVNIFSALNRNGKLYDIDTRLRPSGKQGLLAVSDKALVHYFHELAWTFEYMAFTKARVITGDEKLTSYLTGFIQQQITHKRNEITLKSEVNNMRERMVSQYPTKNPWNIKHVRGGLVDLEFLAQYLLLLHAPNHPDAPIGKSETILHWCIQQKLLPNTQAEELLQANIFMNQLFNMLRLCIGNTMDRDELQPALKKHLCTMMNMADFETLTKKLTDLEQIVYKAYMNYLAPTEERTTS